MDCGGFARKWGKRGDGKLQRSGRSPSPGRRPGINGLRGKIAVGPTGQSFTASKNRWPVGPKGMVAAAPTPGRCPGLGEPMAFGQSRIFTPKNDRALRPYFRLSGRHLPAWCDARHNARHGPRVSRYGPTLEPLPTSDRNHGRIGQNRQWPGSSASEAHRDGPAARGRPDNRSFRKAWAPGPNRTGIRGGRPDLTGNADRPAAAARNR